MIGHVADVEGTALAGEGIEKVVKRLLVGPADGWDGWAMRLFELEPGGHTPRHTHAWPHIDYVTEGRGLLHLDGADHEVEEGSFAFVPAGAEHQFSNAGDDVFAFICIVPEVGES
jgi:quercetin dioxygenase-like cupin family protein